MFIKVDSRWILLKYILFDVEFSGIKAPVKKMTGKPLIDKKYETEKISEPLVSACQPFSSEEECHVAISVFILNFLALIKILF